MGRHSKPTLYILSPNVPDKKFWDEGIYWVQIAISGFWSGSVIAVRVFNGTDWIPLKVEVYESLINDQQSD